MDRDTGTNYASFLSFFPGLSGSFLFASQSRTGDFGRWMDGKNPKKNEKIEYAPCLAGGRARNQPTTTQLYHHFSDVKRKQRRPERTSRARILRWVSFLGGVFGGQQNGKYFKLRHTEDWSGWAARAEVEKQPPNGSGYVIG